ncbi:MAG TPA: hypothetical protein VFW20_11095, partial [Candidatus Limnocylindrales bacterium]|nr:hypothetical protein [Candidatus Limnocylindrales bacterium]
AWQRATRRGPGSFMAEPSRFLLEIPPQLMTGPRLTAGAGGGAGDGEGPGEGRMDDLDLVFGRGATRFGRSTRPGGAAWREGSGRPGAPRSGEAFHPGRDLAAKRDAFAAGARSGSLRPRFGSWDADGPGFDDDGPQAPAWAGEGGATPRPATAPGPVARPIVPGERRYRDGDRVRHARWGDGIVVTSKLTRSDEEVTVAFRDPQVGRKTVLASMANLELVG